MNDQIARFLAKLGEDSAFRARLDGAASAADPENAVKTILSDAGFSFTAEEYRDATKDLVSPSPDGELSEKSLETVVGGMARRLTSDASNFFLAGNLLSRGSKLGGLLSGYRKLAR